MHRLVSLVELSVLLIGLYLECESIQFHFKGFSRTCMAIVFKIDTWDGEPVNKEPEKIDHIKWFSLDDLPSTLLIRHRFIVDAIQDGIPYAEWGF